MGEVLPTVGSRTTGVLASQSTRGVARGETDLGEGITRVGECDGEDGRGGA